MIAQAQVKPKNRNSSRLLTVMGTLWLVLAAALLVYQLSNPTKVEITWETATELNTAGFYIYRSTDLEGEFTQLNEGELINSEGSPVSGSSYSFVDSNVKPGETYYYVLEEVENNLTTNRYNDDMFTYVVPQVTWWAAILTAGSVVVGIALLITGLKESRNL